MDANQPWGPTGPMPPHSRAFDFLTHPEAVEAVRSDKHFFVPSYLEGSTYVQKLQEAHRSRVSTQRESKRSVDHTDSNTISGLPKASLPSGSHRGLSHAVIERPASDDDDDDSTKKALSPLPTRWNRDDVRDGIEVLPDGLSLKYTGPRHHHERDHEASAARADHHMPPQCGVYYYEVHILQGKRDEYVMSICCWRQLPFVSSLLIWSVWIGESTDE